MQISTKMERKAEPSQGGYLESELRGHLLVDGHGELGPNPRAGHFSLPPAHLPPARHPNTPG